ncbi:aminoglycoside phosphotransferase [Rubrobacter xylanophilus DSM 9941]|uniref:Aminoglycoside phosphotransferase n=1 Tax=Rubrobacter xylanophilus (strain DSM 9941 / JCM 11954 / NBRC 16129 / PRD-1) TaxID=266117 RepID=Q1AUA9_RUBXD|nr:fructosamine kinase family protein [Rubrobacter xylanophilus]ABG05019.1 aminoglycoside phosphotransferase [Rubrobacter xylanophilus DSM 9941]
MLDRLLAEGVEASLGERLVSARPLGGGCIGEVWRLELSDGSPVVAKVDREGSSHLEREAYMLRYLRERSRLPVPEVLHSSQSLLLMEFVEGESRFSPAAERHAAELLAELHGVGAGAYGHERDTLIGSLPQPNPWTESWAEFFGEHRLLYLARVAREAGRLPEEDSRRVERLAGRLEEFVGEPQPPGLIHGDVWSANVLAKGGRITAFLDPAIYHADPEVELAFVSLFDSFGEPFFERYAEIRGIREGFFEVRRDLYNLYPLLVHVYFFGGGYLAAARRLLDRFGV